MVSISLIMNGGIIGKANSGVGKYSDEEVLEQIKLAYSEWQMHQYTNETQKAAPEYMADRLEETYGLNDGGVVITESSGTYTVTIQGKDKSYTYNPTTGASGLATTSGNGQGSGTGGTSQAISTITSANYGDYIDLGQNVVGESVTTDDWRILYNDTTNNVVYAILADYLPVAKVPSAAGLDTANTYNVYSNTNRDTLLAGLNHTTAWNSLISSTLVNRGASVKGAVTGEILMASYNAKHGTSLNYTDYPYLWNDPSNPPSQETIDNGKQSASDIDSLYMPRPMNYDNDCYGYWLASPNAGRASRVWFVSCNGNVDTNTCDTTAYGVCPVVSLPSDIQVTNNNGIWSIAQ